MEFLLSFRRHHFAVKPVMGLRNAGCFLTLSTSTYTILYCDGNEHFVGGSLTKSRQFFLVGGGGISVKGAFPGGSVHQSSTKHYRKQIEMMNLTSMNIKHPYYNHDCR